MDYEQELNNNQPSPNDPEKSNLRDSNEITGSSIAESENKNKTNGKKIALILGSVGLFAALFLGFCMTRRSSKKPEVNLPPATVQTNNSTGQLVDNLTATPTPVLDPNGQNPVLVSGLVPNTTNPNAPNPNGQNPAGLANDPRYAPNSGLFQPNQPVTDQMIALEAQKRAMTERGNNAKSNQSMPNRANTGGVYNTGGNTGGGYYNGSVLSAPNDSTLAKIVDATTNIVDNNSNAARRSKAVFYGNASNNSRSNVQINQMANILAGKNLNFNNIPFGTLLPVRTIGAVHTLLPSALARMELTQTVKGDGWTLPSGTIIVGQVSQGIGNRVNITPRGFLLDDQLYPLQGEISGTDGGVGLLGDRKSVGGKWYRSLIDVADRVQQSFNSWLAGRGGGNITNIQYPSVAQMANVSPNQTVSYIAVKPNATGYLLVTQLPASQGNNGGGNLGGNNGVTGIPSSIPGFSIDEVNNILSSGNESAIENLLKRQP